MAIVKKIVCFSRMICVYGSREKFSLSPKSENSESVSNYCSYTNSQMCLVAKQPKKNATSIHKRFNID